MDPFQGRDGSFGPFAGKLMQSKLESYKVDEGYSEETRSQDGSESSMRLGARPGGEDSLHQAQGPNFEDYIRGLSEYERGGMHHTGAFCLTKNADEVKTEVAYALLRSLRASSIARVFDRLWPLFHKDPLEAFPAEIMSFILSYLEPHDLLTISLVSRAWRERMVDSNLWRRKFTVEGWGLNAGEIIRYEEKLNPPGSTDNEGNSMGSAKLDKGKGRPNTSDSIDSAHRWQQFSQLSSRAVLGEKTVEPADQEMTDPLNEFDMISDISPTRGPLASSHDQMQISPPGSSDSQHSRKSFRKPLIVTSPTGYVHLNFHYLFKQKRRLEDNWDKGRYRNFQLPHKAAAFEAHEECVYTIQYQGDYLVSGSRDRTLRIWDLNTGRLARKPLRGHDGSVLCLQFDPSPEEDIIISGSSDSNVILWRFSTGELMKKLTQAHKESVLNLRFDRRFLVTCSKDKTIKIWNRHGLRPGDPDYPIKGSLGGGECPSYIIDAPSLDNPSPRWQPSTPEHQAYLDPYTHLMTLDQHGAAVNAIQIYEDQLVSASGDRNLRVWNIHTGECITKISAHEKGIACVQYDGKRIVSGSSDCTIRIWDPATKSEVARLEGHSRLVRTLQAAFADAPGGRDKLVSEAEEVDRQWHVAQDNGEDLRPGHAGRPARPGSRRPRDLRALGAKIPPSGGGSRWARIISGSYDEKVIIWKKNADDEWIISHQLAQEEALTASGPPLYPSRGHANVNPPIANFDGAGVNHFTGSTPPVPRLPQPTRLSQTGLHPPMVLESSRMNEASSHHPSSSNLPSVEEGSSASQDPRPPRPSRTPNLTLNDLNIMRQIAANRQHLPPPSAPPAPPNNQNNAPPGFQQVPPMPPPALNGSQDNQARPAFNTVSFTNPAQIHTRPAPLPPQHMPNIGHPNARVFKLQFDARRIVCCSQDNKIVGWDFANDDEDIITSAKFFADPQ